MAIDCYLTQKSCIMYSLINILSYTSLKAISFPISKWALPPPLIIHQIRKLYSNEPWSMVMATFVSIAFMSRTHILTIVPTTMWVCVIQFQVWPRFDGWLLSCQPFKLPSVIVVASERNSMYHGCSFGHRVIYGLFYTCCKMYEPWRLPRVGCFAPVLDSVATPCVYVIPSLIPV